MNLSEKTSFSFESEPAEGEVIGVDACALDVLEAPVVKEEERERERRRRIERKDSESLFLLPAEPHLSCAKKGINEKWGGG